MQSVFRIGKIHFSAHYRASVVAVMSLLPFTAAATPAFNWDFKTYYPHADTLQASLTTQQLASINQVDGYYPTSMVNATGAGLTQAELDEVAAMPAYFLLNRDSQTGELSGRAILVDHEDSAAVPDTAQPASFNGDFVTKVMRLTDLYAKATSAQAPQIEQVYSDLIEHFLNQNYLPGGQAVSWLGNGYNWRDRGWKTLRMVHKLSADKRDLYSFNLAYISSFSRLMADDAWVSTDDYHTGFPTAHKGLALMSDTPAKWQLMTMLRRGLDLSIIGQEGDPKNQLVPLDGSIIHHDQHNVHYARYSYGGMLQTHINWTTAGFTSPYTATTIGRMRKGSLAWCFATAGGLNPLHQRSETELLAANSPSDGGIGDGLDFAVRAARLKSAYDGTSIAGDLEMAYAAIAKTGVGSISLPVEWRGITPPATIDSTSPLYTASLMGTYSHTTNGTSIHRGPGQWYASLRGHPTHWRGGESRYDMGTPTHFNAKAMHGSLMLITTGKDGRKPNEVDSGYFRDGWDYSYYPNVTCSDIALNDLLYWTVWAYFGGESNLTGGANLRDSGVWMMKGTTASKSAFMLGNRIVLVNNNINGSNLHTGLIQYGNNTPASEPLVLDGASHTADGDWTLNAGGNHKIVDAQGNGYFVHGVADTPAIKARRGNQSTTYALPENWIGSGPAPSYTYRSDFIANLNNFTPTTANFSKVWFDHGAAASNQAMEYTVLVKPQAGELDAYASAMANPTTAPVKVTKSSKIHRYLDRASGTCAAAVFDVSEALQMHDLVSVNRPGAYIWRNQDGLLRLSVSSSETENTSAFQVTVKGEWSLESEEGTDNVTVTTVSGNTVVSLSYRQAAPQTVVLRRTGNNSAPTWFSSAMSQVNASFGTPFSGSLACEASDADTGASLTFSKVAGPAWLNVAADGTLSGTQSAADGGVNVFTIRVTDSTGAYTDVTLTISVFIPVGNGTWTNAAGGAWITNAHWSGGTVANGTDKIADFSTLNLAADATVTLDGTVSVGGLAFGDTTPNKNWTLNASVGLPLTLATTTGTPTITVNNQSATINAVLAGTQGFQKSGAGALSLVGANTYTGTTKVNQGTVNVLNDQSAANEGWAVSNSNATSTVNFQTGSTVSVASGRSISLSSGFSPTSNLNAAGTVTNNGSLSVGRQSVLTLNSGANWTQNGSMAVATTSATFGSASMTVNTGATFTYAGPTVINLSPSGNNGSGNASLTVAGGTFVTGRGFSNNTNSSTTGSANLTLSTGGTLKLAADVATLATTSGSAFNVRLGNGGAVIDTSGYATTITQGIANVSGQTGSLTKQGAGALTLSGVNSYTGATTVIGGTLAGGGSLAGPVNVQAGGTLAPSGNLTVNNTLALAGAVQMELGKTGGTLSGDKVSGISTVTYGGDLVVTHLGPDALAAGDSFQLFAATTYNGSFTNVTLPTLAGGLVWDTTRLLVDGTISVGSIPAAVADNATVAEDGFISIPVLSNDTDADNDVLAIQSVTQGAHGTVTIVGNSVTYTPAANWNGNDSFSYMVTDHQDGTSTASVTVTVSSVNDTPVFSALADLYVNEDDAFSGSVASVAADLDTGDTLTFSKVSGPAWLMVASNGALSGTPLNGNVGANNFVLRVTDAAGATADRSLLITVANVNDAPTFGALANVNANEDEAFSTSVAGAANDVDTGDTLTFSKVSGPIWLSVASNGTVSGTPTQSEIGSHSLVIRVSDTAGATADSMLAITVGSVNDAPVFTADPILASSGSENVAYTGQTLDSLATDADADDTITYTKVSGPAWLSVAANGALSGTPPAGSTGLNTFVVRASDKASAFDEAELRINVTGLPLPWQTAHVGAGQLAGSATYNAGTFTMTGSGSIDDWSDQFRYTYQTLSGDGQIIAKIPALGATGGSARVGVMIRDTLGANSRHVFLGVNGNGSYRWERRVITGGSTTTTNSNSGTVPNVWVRLVRSGNTITAYKSSNGTSWTSVGNTTVTMASNCYIGLVVASGSTATTNTSQFSNVSATP